MIDRKIAPHIIEPAEFDLQLPAYSHHILRNGVEVFLVDMGETDTLMLNWVFMSGNSYEPKNHLAAATNYLLKNGTSNKNAFQLSEHFDYYGAYLTRNCYNENADISLHCLSKHIRELLPVVGEIISDSIFPEEELAIYKKNAQQRLQVNLKKSEFVANRMIDVYLFGQHHPYGKYTSAEDYDNLTREDLVRFYQRHYQQGKCVIFGGGRFPSDIIDQLNSIFGTLPLQSHLITDLPLHKVTPAVDKKYEIINDPNGVQASIRIASPFPGRQHPDFQKAVILNNIFGGFFGARLMNNIREEKGYTYGIYSYLMNHQHESGWMITTEAGKDVCRLAIEEIYKEMKLIREEPVDEEELRISRNYMIGSILSELDGAFQVAARWKSLILNGVGVDYFNRGVHTIKTITAEELQDIAQRYLQPDNFYELVVI